MLRITIFTTLLLLESVKAETYLDVESIDFIVEGTSNPYMTLRTESSDAGPIFWLDILQDITAGLKLQLCEKWEYDTRGYGGETCGSGDGEPVPFHNGTIHGPVCQELCNTLKHLADMEQNFPGIDSMLGLHNEQCRLKKGSTFNIPRLVMPKVLDVDLHLERDYIDYESYVVSGKHCTPENVQPFIITTLVFFPCRMGF